VWLKLTYLHATPSDLRAFLLKMLSTSFSSNTGEEKWLNGQNLDKFYPIEELLQRIELGPTKGLSNEEMEVIKLLRNAVSLKKGNCPFDHVKIDSIVF
jgi:hypothetical protein